MSDEYDEKEDAVVEYTPPADKQPNVAPRPAQAVTAPRFAPVQAEMGTASAAAIAREMQMVEMQARMAVSNPRHEDTIVGQVLTNFARRDLAEKAMYSIPIAGSSRPVTGPSVHMAKELARMWGNVIYGSYVVDDFPERRTVKGWAWDLETNVRVEADQTFAKMVERKVAGKTQFMPADERQLLTLTNNNAAKVVRNVILQVLPDHIKRKAMQTARKALSEEIKKNPDQFRDDLVVAFTRVGVKGKDIEDLVGKPIKQIKDEATITYLRGCYTRMVEGSDSWHDILAERAEQSGVAGPPPRNAAELRAAIAKKAAETKGEPKKEGDGESS